MSKQTPKSRVLFARSLWPALLVLFGVFSLAFANLRVTPVAQAATANTINFQARLQSAAGAVVPDGDYNVEFKLYDDGSSTGSSQGSCSGDSHCLWTETRTGGNKVTVKNGYLSVNLGSVTAFSGINWDQKLWLTMNIGGTGSASWDGEMDPKLPLTAVPYAFSAGQLANTATGGRSTLSFQGSASGHGDQNFVIQDQGAAGTYSLLTTAQANAGYIQLQGSTPGTAQTGNFNITGTGIAASLQASDFDRASSGTLTFGNTNATTVNIATNAAGHTINIATGTGTQAVTIGSTSGLSTLSLQGGTSITTNVASGGTYALQTGGANFFTADATGRVIFKPTSDNSNTFNIQNATGTNIFSVDSSADKITAHQIEIASTYNLSLVSGYINIGGSAYGSYTTPAGSTVNTKILVPNSTLAAGSQVLALGTDSSSAANARVITAFDGRTGAHQPTIGIVSPSDGQIFGLSYDGSNTTAYLKASNDNIVLQSSGLDIVTATNSSGTGLVTVNGAFQSGSSNQFYVTSAGVVSTSSTINSDSGFKYNGTAGATTTCSSGNVLQNIVVQGGIVTGGSCGAGGGVGGSGTSGKLAKFTASGTIGDSIMSESGTTVTVAGTIQASDLDTASAGTLTIGTANATTLNIATNSANHTVNMATGSAIQTVTIGSTFGASGLTLQGGNNGITMNSGTSFSWYSGANNILYTDATGIFSIRPYTDSATAFVVKSRTGSNNVLSVNTSNDTVYADNLEVNGAGNLTLTNGGITINGTGGISLQSGALYLGGSTVSTYTTPAGSNVDTKINIPIFDPGAFGQIIAMGLPSSAASSSRVLSLFDARTSPHQPTISVFDPGETNVFGFSWEGTGGSSGTGYVKNTANNIALQAGGRDILTASYLTSSTSQVTLGQGSAVQGNLTFSNSTNSNGVTLTSGATSSAYTMVLPTAIGSANQCVSIASVASSTATLGYANCLTDSTGVQLQASPPGTAQTGNFNISGTGAAATLQASSFDTSSAAAMTIGATNANAINLGKTGSNIQTTVNGTFLIKPTSGNDSATAFVVQNASSVALLTADTNGSRVIIGDTTNGIILSATGIQLKGTAQNAKTVTLTPEYAGAVFDSASDSACTSANNGSISAGYDSTNFTNYYKWISGATAQCYDVVLRIPLPSDFSSWASSTPITIRGYTANTTSGTIKLYASDTSNGAESSCNYASATPVSTTTWTTTGSNCTIAGTYTADGVMTLKVRMTGDASSDVRISNIVLSYKSKF